MMGKIQPVELAERMKTVIAQLDELADDMDDSSTTCNQCGLVVRKNLDDYQAKQAFEAASGRVLKQYEKLISGIWVGRDLVPVVSAQSEREKS